MLLTWLQGALNERIANETIRADAHRGVTDHSTLGVGTTGTRARVATLLTDASQVRRALAVADALWLAIRWGSEELGQAGARG